MARLQGDSEAARRLLEESLPMFRELGDGPGVAHALHGLGMVAQEQGDRERAVALCRQGLAIRYELGDRTDIELSLEALAGLYSDQGQAERAARLFGAAEATRDAIGAPLPPLDRAGHERHVAALRAALGENAFAAAWAAGRELTLEQAVALANEETAGA